MERANVSSQFKNIISKSLLINSGPPAVYQLQTKKAEFGPLARITFGKKNLNKANRTVLLVGETGAGKSTVINSLVNHTMGVKFEDEVWFQIVEDEKRGQTESQTSDVIVYEVFGFEDQTLPFSLTIIDTPGFGDTRGIEKDLIVSQRLFDLFRSDDGINEIHAVGLVVKATDNRVSDRLSYVFNSVMSLFGKNLEKSIVALVTHSDGRPPKNVLQALEATKIKCAKDEENQPIYFLFDNSQTEDRSEDIEFLEIANGISEKGMKAFTAFLEKKAAQKLITTTDVLNERISLTACIQNLQERILLKEQKQNELKQTHDALVKQIEGMKKSQTFTVEVDVVYKEKEPLKSKMIFSFFEKAMVCTVCEENCHYPGCTISRSPQHCEVMRKGRCTVCTKKCPASNHVKENWRYVLKTKKVKKTVEVKNDMQAEKADQDKKFHIIKSLAEEINKLKSEKFQLVDESYQHVIRLEEIALKVDSVSTFVHLDFLIEKLKEAGDTKRVQKLEEMRSRMDEGTKLALQYLWHKTTLVKAPRKVSGSSSSSLSSTPPTPSPAPLPRTKIAVGHSSLPIGNLSLRNSSLDSTISESILIQSGNPSVYQLRATKVKSEKLTRVTVGEKDGCKRHKTILLVGETGAGKSTLINALLNFIMGVKFQDKVWFRIVEEVDHETSEVIVYEIFGFEGKIIPYSLSIIDTPGFGSTRGTEHDANISQRLFDLFQSSEGIHAIHGVGLVMKASDNRLSDRLMYVLNSVMSLFGKNIEDNIAALITHSNGRTPKNVLQALEVSSIKCAKDEKQQPVYFLFNNCQSEDRNEEAGYLEGAHKLTERGLTEFTAFLEKSQPKNVKRTVDVIKERSKLTACIQNLQQRIIETEQKQNQIRNIQEKLIKSKEDMKNNKDFVIEIDESYKVKEAIKVESWFKDASYEGAMCCTRCEENCHYPGCTLAPSPAFCDVIKGGYCIVCTGKCPTSHHVKEKWRYVTKTRKVKTTAREMELKFENSKTEKEKDLSYLESLETTKKLLTAQKYQLLDESYDHIVKLEKIALKVDSASTLVHLDFLIEKMKEKGDKRVRKLERIKRNMDEGCRAALQYQHIPENPLKTQ